jgi:hypothetical protein
MYSATLRLANDNTESSLALHIEPWADEFVLLPGENIEIEFDGPHAETIEVAHRSDRIVVYGFRGAMARLKRNGVVSWEAHQRLPL